MSAADLAGANRDLTKIKGSCKMMRVTERMQRLLRAPFGVPARRAGLGGLKALRSGQVLAGEDAAIAARLRRATASLHAAI